MAVDVLAQVRACSDLLAPRAGLWYNPGMRASSGNRLNHPSRYPELRALAVGASALLPWKRGENGQRLEGRAQYALREVARRAAFALGQTFHLSPESSGLRVTRIG